MTIVLVIKGTDHAGWKRAFGSDFANGYRLDDNHVAVVLRPGGAGQVRQAR